MKNADQPIVPITTKEGEPISQKYLEQQFGTIKGLTKREHFAAKAFQGLLSNSFVMQAVADRFPDDRGYEYIAGVAIISADCLLKQLEATNE